MPQRKNQLTELFVGSLDLFIKTPKVMRPVNNIIELNTERLLLRQWLDTDLAHFANMNASDDVMAYFPSKLSRFESDALALRLEQQISTRGWGLWAIEEKQSNNFIGFTGLHPAPSTLAFSPAIEIGWRLSDKYWGKGYASEAASQALRFAFLELGLDEVVSFTARHNKPSRKVMARIHMIDAKQNFLHPDVADSSPLKEHALYTINKALWLKNQSDKLHTSDPSPI